MVELILVIACTGVIDVEVHQRDGSVKSGTATTLGADVLTLQSDEHTSTILTADVREVRATGQAKPLLQKPTLRVKLRGGSVVAAAQYTTNNGRATLKLATSESLELSTRDIELVVLTSPNKQIDQNRNEILARQLAGDIVIIRRKNQNLDYVDGVLGDVTEQSVQFQFGEEWIDVKRSKIDSFSYFRGKAEPVAKPRFQLVTTDGSSWQATQLALQDGQMHLTLADNLTVALPAETLRTIKFASTSTVFLSDLQPHRVTLTPSLQIAALAEDLAELKSSEPFLPSRDRSLFGQQQNLTLAQSDGTLQQYEKGVAIHSRTELTYRLAGEYRELNAIAGLDPLVRKVGCVNLIVRTDSNELFRSEIRGGMSPTDIKLDVSGAKWLTILVDYGDASDVADRLNLCDARLIK